MGATVITLRWLWFLTVGWMLAAAWWGISVLLMVSIVGYPLGSRMKKRTEHVAFLKMPSAGAGETS